MPWFKRTRKKKTLPADAEETWVQCPKCTAHIFSEEWHNSYRVCPQCNYHDRLTSDERIDQLTDAGSFKALNPRITTDDPLGFVDGKGSYKKKAEDAKAKTGLKESVVTGTAKLKGRDIAIAVMDFRFMGGSLSGGAGDKIARAAMHALKHRTPYIVVSASGGARMHEGIISLMQMAKTCSAIAQLNKAGIPYISILTDPTTGGVSASYAMVGDINIAEPGAMIAFAGRRVIEQTIKQKLPDDFQTAEYLQEHGFVDMICKRVDMKETLASLLEYMPG